MNKDISKKIWKWLNKEMPVKYMALYFFILMILLETCLIGCMRYQKRYLYGLGEEEGFRSDISNKCFETLDGKFCMIPKKVMWYERTDIEGVKK